MLITQKSYDAKRFLIESNKSIKEIAYECGFENDSYFYTLFKKTEGISPSAYQRKAKDHIPQLKYIV